MARKRTAYKVIVSLITSVLLLVTLLPPITAGMTTPGIRVIVQGQSTQDAAAAVAARGGTVESEISIINAVIATIAQDRLEQLQADGRIVRVTPDRSVELADKTDYSRSRREPVDVEFTKAIGAKPVWQSGDLGNSITVAVLDTGIDPRFTELRSTPHGRGDRFLAYYDAISDRLYQRPYLLRSPGDPNGHGTHVAGIIANSTYEQDDREYRGVAPAANLVAVRVLNEDGAGTYADVLRGIEWVVQHKDQYKIRVLNISMYAVPIAPYWADPYNLAVMAAWNAGIVVVASVGNTGPSPMSVGVPGNTPYIITVGAFTDARTPEDFGDDYIPEFSAAGPTLDAFTKPDVIAPGAHIVSLMYPTASIRQDNPDSSMDVHYFEMSGSSMATAVVSGVSALVLGEDRHLTPDEVKYRIMQTARPQVAEVGGSQILQQTTYHSRGPTNRHSPHSQVPDVNDGQLTAAYSIWQQGAGRVWAADAALADVEGSANQGMDLARDLAGEIHYQGWTTYSPETQTFQVIGGGFNGQLDNYTIWDGSYDSWADGYDSWATSTNWADSFDSWADSFDSWADSFDSWADSFDSWADGFNSWADSFDSWADSCTASATSAQSVNAASSRRHPRPDPGTSETDRWAADFASWANTFSAGADSFDSWADFVTWADSFGSWADSFDSWADSTAGPDGGLTTCGAWVGSFDSWADSFGGWVSGMDSLSAGLTTWTGAFTTWEGGYLTWSSSFASWADSFDSWADGYLYWAAVCSVDSTSFDSWADSFDSWADFVDFVNWANSFDSWADFTNFVNWANGFGSWADFIGFVNSFDSFDSWADFVTLMGQADSFDSWADFKAYVNSFDSWADSFSSWADSFSSWADFTAWVGSFDSWADSFDSWADSFGSWADFTAWVDSFGSWADSFGSWADLKTWAESFGSWADSFGSWADSFGSWADSFASWADFFEFVNWIDGFNSWADFVTWADGFDSWADSFSSWADSFGSWADSFDSWADYVAWVGSFDSWADSFSSWADSFDSWADSTPDSSYPVICGSWSSSFDSWADSFSSWADSFDSWADGDTALMSSSFEPWSGGYTIWGGGSDLWSGSSLFGGSAAPYADPVWARNYRNLTNLPSDTSFVSINDWVNDD